MSTIKLNYGMINQISDSFIKMSGAFDDLSSRASALIKNFSLIDSGVTDVSIIQNNLQMIVNRQEIEINSADSLDSLVDSFIEDTISADEKSAEIIQSRKNEFYKMFSYLKPECEKTWWENFKEACSDAVQWCKDTFSYIKKICLDAVQWCKDTIEYIKENGFFNCLGRCIHLEAFREFVGNAVGLFYRIGGIGFIKFLAETGTEIALWCDKHPYLSGLIPGMRLIGELAPGFFSIFLSADMDQDGVYHIRPDCWQQYTHYTTGYDDVFRAGVNTASGGEISVDAKQSKIFWVDLDSDGEREKGEDFIIWSWKGDYTNIGAGAETGLYQVMDAEYNADGSYAMNEKNLDEYAYIYAEVNREYEVEMSLKLYHDKDGDREFSDSETVYDYRPDEKQWWVNGFNPLYQNVKSEDLRTVTTINFDSWEDKELAWKFYNAIKEENKGKVWTYNDEDLTVTLDWRY
ncbi:MAG: hypothetical protein PUE12_08070 [Oscillospiraceae bacterium]|nr:hypothetical protein [Oscillospiraceae bacterium]